MNIFQRCWKFLLDKNNQGALAIILVVIGGLWAGFVYFSDKSTPTPTQIVLTEEVLEAFLNRRNAEIREELSASTQDQVKRFVLEKELQALEQKKTHLEESIKETEKVYASTVKLLEEKLGENIPADQIAQAKKALQEGNPALAESLLQVVVESGTQKAAEASYQLGLLAKDRIDFEAAWQSLSLAAQLAPENSLYLNKAGLMADTLGQYDKAIAYYKKALASDLATFGPEHPDVAIRWNNLGSAWEAKGQYDKAAAYYEKALASDLKTYGPDHPQVAIRWNNLGGAWHAKGQYDKAIEYFEKALASDLATFGPEHPDVAIRWNNLGSAWHAKGQYDQAIEYFEKALAVFKQAGLEHRVKLVEGNIQALRKKQ